jgi:CHASE3 domain sensor protein
MIRRGLNLMLRDLRDTLGSHPVGILAGVGVLLVALLVTVAVTLLAENAAQSRRDELAKEVEPYARDLSELEAAVLMLSTDLRGFILTGDASFRERYAAGRTALDAHLAEVTASGERAGFGVQTNGIATETRAYADRAEAAYQAAERGDTAAAARLIAGEATTRLDAATAQMEAVRGPVMQKRRTCETGSRRSILSSDTFCSSRGRWR